MRTGLLINHGQEKVFDELTILFLYRLLAWLEDIADRQEEKTELTDYTESNNAYNQTYQNIQFSFNVMGNVLGYTNDCMDSVKGNYSTSQSYTYDKFLLILKLMKLILHGLLIMLR